MDEPQAPPAPHSPIEETEKRDQSPQECEKQPHHCPPARARGIEVWGAVVGTLTLVGLVVYTVIQWHLLVQARVATDAATKSADAAQRQLEAIDRAWIYAELPVIESCTLHPQGVRFDVRFTFKNVGRAVARHISYSATLMVLTAHGGNIVRQIVDQIEGEGRIQCERAPQSFKEMGTPGPTLFPGETGGPRKADDLRVENSRIEAGAEQLPEDTRRSWEPTIVGCVVYLLPNSQTMHHTRFSYVIRKETLDKIGNPLPLGVGENVTAKDLVLMPLGMVGTDAD